MKFDPALHTVEARGIQIGEILEAHPSALLVGSVARQAILGEEVPLNGGRFGTAVRDLDFTSTSDSSFALTDAERQPFPADDLLTGLINVDEQRGEAKVMFEASRPDVAVTLPADIFEPYPITVSGVRAQTFHPDVMRRLHLIMNSSRAKDRRNIAAFEAGLKTVDYAQIPDPTFEPLKDLGRMVLADPQLRRQRRTDRLQEMYSDLVPDAVRNSLKPMVGILKRASIVSSRY